MNINAFVLTCEFKFYFILSVLLPDSRFTSNLLQSIPKKEFKLALNEALRIQQQDFHLDWKMEVLLYSVTVGLSSTQTLLGILNIHLYFLTRLR